MIIKVKALDGTKIELTVNEDDTVLTVKQQLAESVSLDVAQLRLIHLGVPLKDETTLQESRVTSGSTLHMIAQLRGGFF